MSDGKLSNRWLPLESNPDVINKYVTNLGVDLNSFEFTDIYGLDEELLAIVPRPVIAVMLLFPITKEYKEYIEKKEQEIKDNGQNISKNLYYTKQTVENACGTVAIIHALANNSEILKISGIY
jgi:ubiquitin carboxyl-terminal hydrolase L3